MANEQHLEWLMEGVEAWNARRARDDFPPDLRGAKLRWAELHEAELYRADLRDADLQGANLREANLQEAILIEANLLAADLKKARLYRAKLQGSNMRRTDLEQADLKGATLERADLKEADLKGAQLNSTAFSVVDTIDGKKAEWTDLSTALSLTQNQLDEAEGDNGTLLPGDNRTANPDNLVRPFHWYTIIDLPEDHPNYVPNSELQEDVRNAPKEDEDTAPTLENSQQSDSPQVSDLSSLRQHVEIILLTAPAAGAAGRDAADRLEHAVTLYHCAAQKNTSDEGEIVLEMAAGFRSLSDSLMSLETAVLDKDGLIAVLQTRLQEQEKLVAALKGELANKDSASKQVFLAAVGAAAGSAWTAAGAQLFGSDGATWVNNFWGLMTQGGTVPVPPPTPPVALPPTTAL